MSKRTIILKPDLLQGLQRIGIKKGQSIMVHTSLSSFGYVCGGAQIIIEALLESVGEEGTIMMPTQSWRNLDPSYGVHWKSQKSGGL